MSAKKTTKKTSGKRTALWVIVAIEILILAAVLLIWWALSFAEKTTPPAQTQPSSESISPAETSPTKETEPQQESAVPPVVEEIVDTTVYLDDHLQIVNVGAYTGVYMEDGSDEVVSGVLMLVVSNIGKEAVQYAEITLPTENGDAKFSLSTLPAGESCVLLELNRMPHTGQEDLSRAYSQNVAVFHEAFSLWDDLLELQVLDGAINVRNISGADIEGDVVLYYKNAAADLYYGGITYRIRIEGGMKANEIKQIMASHFDQDGSKVMFVTVN